MLARRTWAAVYLLSSVVGLGCAMPGEDELGDEEESPYVDPGVEAGKEDQPGAKVDTYAGGCSTAPVLGLSRQIAQEIQCLSPGMLTRYEPGDGIVFVGAAVLPFLEAGALEDLQDVARSRTVQLSSGFRTLPQQYLLYKWYRNGRCGIPIAATPGRSNHETGRAVDVRNWSSVKSSMNAHRWAHDVPGDDVHFDHLSSPDLRGMDVLAFQRLWNRNHPEDPLDESGDYDNATASRVGRAPAGGFGIGACGDGGEPGTLRIDNDDADFTAGPGWWASTSTQGFEGKDYLVTDQATTATWSFPIEAPGRYELVARYTPFGNRARVVWYVVSPGGGAATKTVAVSQRSGGSASLGVYDLVPGAHVTLETEGADGYIVADAMVAKKR